MLHGTTTATNAILEGKGAPTGLLTTAGFRYVLEIGRHDIPRRANMFAWVKPARPVPPELIFEIGGRVAVDGEEIEPLDEAAVRAAARRLRAGGRRLGGGRASCTATPTPRTSGARARCSRGAPGCAVSLSSEVLPVFREFERSMATVLNAYVQPLVGRYVGRLAERLRERGVAAPLSIMKSNGGVIGAEAVRTQAIHTALSGPAAGVIGARLVGEAAGFDDVISVDVGGTSADVCLIRGGEAAVTVEGRIGSWPLHVPMIDIHTIGAGGGSIARVTEDGTLTVGPESAGAAPGPACYGAGGEEPTVTDAHLVLGRIPAHLLGGEIALDVDRARRAIEERVARPLGLPLEAAASGILDIVDNNMVGAHPPGLGGARLRPARLRAGAVRRRRSAPRRRAGRAPRHAHDRGPPPPGRAVDVRPARHRGAQRLRAHEPAEAPRLRPRRHRRRVRRAGGAGPAWLAAEGVPAAGAGSRGWPTCAIATRASRSRCRGPSAISRSTRAQRASTSATAGSTRTRCPTRRWRSSPCAWPPRAACGASRFPCLAAAASARAAGPAPRLLRRRRLDGCPCIDRDTLGAGAVVTGPAIVEQLDSTTVVPPGQRARVDRFGNLVIRAGTAGAMRRPPPRDAAARSPPIRSPARSSGARSGRRRRRWRR